MTKAVFQKLDSIVNDATLSAAEKWDAAKVSTQEKKNEISKKAINSLFIFENNFTCDDDAIEYFTNQVEVERAHIEALADQNFMFSAQSKRAPKRATKLKRSRADKSFECSSCKDQCKCYN